MLRHVVMVKIKAGESPEQCLAYLAELRREIPHIRALSYGLDTKQKPDSYDLAFVIDFDDAEGLRRYDTHPFHLRFKDEIRRVRVDSITADYEI